MIKFLPLGGADDVGASCYFIEIDGTGILLDCGIHPGKKGKEALPDFSLLDNLNIDFVIISHAHQDHLGALPFLIQRIPHLIIFTTLQTKEIAELTLNNSAKILKENFAADESISIYSHEEINLVVRSIRTYQYGEVFELKGLRHLGNEPIKISFHDAGHILGSASVLIEYNEEKILYTGDIKFSPQVIMSGAVLPKIKAGTIITETTYGASDSALLSTWEKEAKRFAKAANKIIDIGGAILIPVFALGKTQEILALINHLQVKRILAETDIYSGGLGRDISKVYDKNKYVVSRNYKNLDLHDIPQLNLYDVIDYQEFVRKPGIILASSGMMLENTASYKLANFWLRQKNFGIFFVGYVEPNSPGYRLMNKKEGDVVQLSEYSEPVQVKCSIERFYFTSHSKREEILEMSRKLKPGRVILVHGETDAKNWIGNSLLKENTNLKVYSAETGKQIIL